MAMHLTFPEREFLYRLIKKGVSKAEIARLMGRHRSTIYRELGRNAGQRGYRPQQAQRLARARRLPCRRPAKMDHPEVRPYVQEKLGRRWSPDQIAGRVRRDFPHRRSRWLSHQTIYNWINRHRPEWKTFLRRGGRPPETRGKLADCVRIDGRGDVINRRRRYGDWEGDTIIGQGRRSALVTLVERKSGRLRMGRADDLKATTTARVIQRRLHALPRAWRRSLTFDNGKEFAQHQEIARVVEMEIYFALPYRSWQRGTNENTNGLLRQFFPKGTDFMRISHQAVARVEQLLNERPRKRLGYRTPNEVFTNHQRRNCRN